MTQQKPRRGRGEGGVSQRDDGLWEARFDVGYRNGRRVRKSVYGRTKQEALRELRDQKLQHERGQALPDSKLTVAVYLAQWLEQSKRKLQPTTWRRWEQLIRLYITPAIGRTKLAKLTPMQIEQLYSARLDAGASPTTVLQLHHCLHRALAQAEQWEMIARNPAARVDKPRASRFERTVFTPEQRRAILAAAEGDRLEALYWLALTVGMREAELLGLRWQDVDCERGILRVVQTVQYQRGGGYYFKAPKNGKGRSVELIAATIELLRRHRVAQAGERLRVGPAWKDDDLVFPSTSGTPYSAQNFLRREWAALLRRAEIPYCRFDLCRHSTVSYLLSAGVPPMTVARIVGHGSMMLTTAVYSHAVSGEQRQATDAMERLMRAENG